MGIRAEDVAAAMAACALGAIVGSKVLMFDFHDPLHGEKTLLGAVAGGMLTLALVRPVLRLESSVFDLPITSVLWGAAVARLGCFVVGCCHGIGTTLPWGVRSGEAGPVHPTQLYEATLTVALAVLLKRNGRHLRHPGSRALAGGAGLALIRFAVEPLRASAVMAGPLTMVQWTTLAVALVALMTLIVRESGSELSTLGRRLSVPGVRICEFDSRRSALLVGMVIVAVVAAGDWLTPLEQLVARVIAFLSAIAVMGRMVPVVSLSPRAVPLLGLAAVAPLQSPVLSDSTRRFLSFGGGGIVGGYEITTEDCEGNTISRTQHNYRVAAGTVELRQENAKGEGFGLRVVGFKGTDKSPGERFYGSPNPQPTFFAYRHDAIQGGSLLFAADGPSVGIQLGIAAGNWNFAGDYPIYDDGSSRSRIMPIGGLRLGASRKRHGEISIGTGLAPAPAPLTMLGLAFPDSQGRRLLRVGISDAGAYVGGEILTPGNFELEPLVIVGGATLFQGGVSIRKRIYLK